MDDQLETLSHEELTDALRSCLVERLALRKQRDRLIATESEIFNPSMYMECITTLNTVNSKLHKISWKIPRLCALYGMYMQSLA